MRLATFRSFVREERVEVTIERPWTSSCVRDGLIVGNRVSEVLLLLEALTPLSHIDFLLLRAAGHDAHACRYGRSGRDVRREVRIKLSSESKPEPGVRLEWCVEDLDDGTLLTDAEGLAFLPLEEKHTKYADLGGCTTVLVWTHGDGARLELAPKQVKAIVRGK